MAETFSQENIEALTEDLLDFIDRHNVGTGTAGSALQIASAILAIRNNVGLDQLLTGAKLSYLCAVIIEKNRNH